uniref:Uncharacterized protein n=1 Tax=Anguilla anguilla TaxID=7936 RepID=A0A0E9SDB1_ANGAN
MSFKCISLCNTHIEHVHLPECTFIYYSTTIKLNPVDLYNAYKW